MGKYSWGIFIRAIKRSWGKWGMTVNLLLYASAIVAYLIIRKPTTEKILNGELMLAVWFLLAVFLLTFVVNVLWEKQAVFANVRLEKRNTSQGAEIVIWNYEINDLTELSVEILQKTWVSRENKISIYIVPDNRPLVMSGVKIVTYGGGSRTIRVASGEGGNATFHTNSPEPDTLYENYDGADHAIFDITVQVKGKIKGCPIYPKLLKGRLKYIRTIQEVPLPFPFENQIKDYPISKMEWENLH